MEIMSYNLKVDIYSFGMVLWELWERKVPFSHYHQFDIADAVKAGKRPQISMNCPPAFRTLIRRCWAQSPTKRPQFKQIVTILRDELMRAKKAREREEQGFGGNGRHMSTDIYRRRNMNADQRKPKNLFPFMNEDGFADTIHEKDENSRERSASGGTYSELSGDGEEDGSFTFRSSEGSALMAEKNRLRRRRNQSIQKEPRYGLTSTWKKFFGGNESEESEETERETRRRQDRVKSTSRSLHHSQSDGDLGASLLSSNDQPSTAEESQPPSLISFSIDGKEDSPPTSSTTTTTTTKTTANQYKPPSFTSQEEKKTALGGEDIASSLASSQEQEEEDSKGEEGKEENAHGELTDF
jgi:hypothetical protein